LDKFKDYNKQQQVQKLEMYSRAEKKEEVKNKRLKSTYDSMNRMFKDFK